VIGPRQPFYNQAYIDRGRGPVIILLHGLFGNLALWRHVVTTLERAHRVIVPRLPLYELPERYTNIEYLAHTLQEFLDWHQLTGVTLVGHALGGQLALKHAYLFPDHVSQVVLSGCTGGLAPEAWQAVVEEDHYAVVHQRLRDVFYDDRRVTDTLVNQVYDTVHNTSKRLAIRSLTQVSDQNDVGRFLYRIEQEVLLVWGLQDKVTPPEAALHFHDSLPNSTLHFIDQCGHLPMVEHAGAFNDHVLSFLNGKV
jgi:pimeloyl-ACP methyl ester carboxylesterase